MTITTSSIFKDIEKIKQNAPLVHNITNFVVMNTTANALLSIGASPVMAHAVPEVEDMVNIANCLVINIGTLSDPWIEAMFKAAKKASARQIPIVIDPVGVGATPYRTQTARQLIQASAPSIIRGNGSEIMALCQQGQRTKGVDSTNASEQAIDAAKALSLEFNCVVCITGKVDYIVSQNKIIQVKNGHEMMPYVTGLGCTATALCGAFAAINTDYQKATAHAMAVMGIAGEIAAQSAHGPGSLQVNFIDTLYQLSKSQIEKTFKA
jgi:hydroxyethylthiazole kinase